MTVAVLGAYGQLGTDLCAAFAGRRVLAFGRHDFDVRDAERVRGRLSECRPDVIVNTTAFHQVAACEEDPETAFAVNAAAPFRLAQLARELGARFVHVSTDYVYGGSDIRPLSEDVPPAPVQVYGASKAAGEWLVQLAHPGALIVRSSGLFGTAGARGKGGNFVETVIRLAREQGEMRIVHDQVLSPTYTADLAAVIVRLVDQGVGGIVHVTNSGSCSWYELACHVVSAAGLGVVVQPVSTVDFGAPVRRPSYSVLENGRLKALGLAPLRPWSEAVNAYLQAKGVMVSDNTGVK